MEREFKNMSITHIILVIGGGKPHMMTRRHPMILMTIGLLVTAFLAWRRRGQSAAPKV